MQTMTPEVMLIKRLAQNQTQMPLIDELKATLVSSGLYSDNQSFYSELRSIMLSQVRYQMDKNGTTIDEAIESVAGDINTKELAQNLINQGINKRIFFINFEHESAGGYNANFSDTRTGANNKNNNFNIDTNTPTVKLANALNTLLKNELTANFVRSFIENKEEITDKLMPYERIGKIKEDLFVRMETLKMSEKLNKLGSFKNKLKAN